ncbi:MAG: metalloregulator ArsR/SmtB family transcription factor [Pyrinomonadaceae bacterium]
MQESDFGVLENLFLALSDKTRLRLLALMANGEVSVGYLADSLGESQPKISRHLAYLRSAGLVSTRRDGKWIYYGIESQGDPRAERVLNSTLREIDQNVRQDTQTHTWNGYGDAYRPPSDGDAYADTHMNNWEPNELDVHLL